MNNYVKDRAFLPVAIPVGVLVLIGMVAVAMSRILLNVPKEIATAVALMVAFNILVVCAVVASRPNLAMMETVPMLGVAMVPVLIGLAVAGGMVEITGGEGHGAHEEDAKIAISAQGLAFDTKELKVPAGKPFKMEFTNNEAAPHNVVIQKDATSTDALFKKPFFGGPKTVTWEVEPLAPGTYFFKCEVHPNMNGTVIAEESAGSEAEHPAPETKVSISAKDLKFNKAELTIPADSEFELEFNNQEAQPHNVTILRAKGSTEALFKEQFFAGPKKVTWKVPAIPAGKYYFLCDVHPTMNGTVTAT